MPLSRLAGHHVLELLQGGLAPVPTDLDVRCRDRHQHDDVRDRCGGFGERLSERELRVEVTASETISVPTISELARVGHPLVDKDHGGPELLEQSPQRGTGVRASFVVRPDELIAGLPAELVCEMAPQRAQLDALLGRWGADGEIIWPTRTARLIFGGRVTSDSERASPTPGKSLAATPEARW